VTADRLWPLRRCIQVIATGLLVVACGGLSAGGPTVHFENRTNTPLAIHVNSLWVGTYAAGASAELPLSRHGAPPFLITVKSPSGASLVDFQVTAQDIKAVADGSGAVSGSTGLPCGVVRLTVGRVDEVGSEVAVGDLPPCP